MNNRRVIPLVVYLLVLVLVFSWANKAFGRDLNQVPYSKVVELLRQVREAYPEKTIWAFSGYLFDKDILSGKLGDWEITREYLGLLDVLVDGPYVEARRNLSLRFRGSENQRIINVPASLSSGTVVLWEDWQGDRKGMI